MLHTEEIAFFEVFKTQFPPRDPILGNVIGPHYYHIVAWVATDLIGITISRNQEAEVMKKIFKMLHIWKIMLFYA